MKYTIITGDGSKYPFDENFLDFVEERMKDGNVFELAGALIRGSDIKRVVKGHDSGEYGPHLSGSQQAYLTLEEGMDLEVYAEFFWKKVADMNMRRQREDKFWMYAALVKWAQDENGGTKNLSEIEAFVDSEPELAKEKNVPKL